MNQNFGSNCLLVGSNYVYPYDCNRMVTDHVVQAKGKIVDDIYVPVDATAGDFKRVIHQIQKLKPDVSVSSVVGEGVQHLYQAYAGAGLDPATMPIAAAAASEADIVLMSPGIAQGHYLSTVFFENLQTPSAQRFVKASKARFAEHAPVTACAKAA